MKVIQSATLGCALPGQPVIAPDSEGRKLLECGLCIGQGSDELRVALCEPMIVETALHYFGGFEGYLIRELASMSGNRSGSGHKFELIVPLDLWDKI